MLKKKSSRLKKKLIFSFVTPNGAILLAYPPSPPKKKEWLWLIMAPQHRLSESTSGKQTNIFKIILPSTFARERGERLELTSLRKVCFAVEGKQP